MVEVVPIDTPEYAVFRNACRSLTQQNWDLGLSTQGIEELNLTVPLPNSLRLLTEATIINTLKLNDGDSLKSGYTVEHRCSDDRTYVNYHGSFEVHVLDALVGLLQLSENKAADFNTVTLTPFSSS